LLPDVYYIAFPKDRMNIKLGVMAILGMGAAQTVFGVLDFYNFASRTLLRDNTTGPPSPETSPVLDHVWFSVTISSAVGEIRP
jgi:hypothetical protein